MRAHASFLDDAIAARRVRNSERSIVIKRNGCKPIGEVARGLSSSAIASMGPTCVENISSTTAPGLSGLSTRSSPPLAEIVWSLAEERCPSPNRIVAEGMPSHGSFGIPRAGRKGELMGSNMLWKQ